jgi:uncharacterized Ntn-hydrolase superfamily protein
MNLSTFSIVARDEKTGNICVAGGTNWFCYGRWVPHISAGFGAVATQAETNMWYGSEGIQKLEKENDAESTLNSLLKEDPDKDGAYQLLIIDNNGNTAGYTGNHNHVYAGHILKKNLGVAGNTLVSEKTLTSIINFYEKSKLAFPLRVIKALQAGHKAGGDIRGMKSAAFKMAKGKSSGKYWEDIIFNLRVDESDDPLKELERLYYVAEAYACIDEAESCDDAKSALKHYKKALELDPGNEEVLFWMARAYDLLGNKEKVKELLGKLKKGNGKWDEYWERLG